MNSQPIGVEVLTDIRLGRPRVVAKQAAPKPSPLAANWAEVMQRAKQPPILRGYRAPGSHGAARAAYDAGGVSRINYGWAVSTLNANRELRFSLATLRARSRELERNDPYFKKFLELVETNIVGHQGIAVQSRAGESGPAPDFKFVQDRAANSIIEREWAAFSRAGQFEVTGKLNRAAFERLLIRAIARDGEVLVKTVSDPLSRCGVRFQMLEADWLDETYNAELADGTRIVMGVEMDPSGRPAAYHLLTRHPGDGHGVTRERVRYAAGAVRHYFMAERPEQVRGVPWGHAAMSRLYQLGEFDDAAILAARLGADKFMVLEDADGMAGDIATSLADGTLAASPDDASTPGINEATGALYFQSQKGSIDILPRGTRLADWNPNYPSDTYGPFVLAALRGVASGFGISYESLSNDRNGVTWTSIRHAVLDEREHWKTLQDWLIETWAWDAYTTWLDAALLSPFKPLNYLPAGKRDKFLAPVFNGRRWDWVNPADDIAAKREALSLRLTSHRRVLAEQGLDLEEVLAEIQDDRALAAAYGVDLDAALDPSSSAAPEQAAPEPDDPALADDPPAQAKPRQRRPRAASKTSKTQEPKT